MRDDRSSVDTEDARMSPLNKRHNTFPLLCFRRRYTIFTIFNFLLKSGTWTSMMLGKSSTTIVLITLSDILIMVMGLKIKNVWTPDVIENGTQVLLKKKIIIVFVLLN